jgi:hypothetical protein
MAPTGNQARIIADLKNSKGHQLAVKVRANTGTVVGHLVPIGHDLSNRDCVIEDLCRWRTTHMSAFLSVFTPSVEGTRTYLRHVVLRDPARILFLVADAAFRPIGVIGLRNVSANEAEFDSVIRGATVETRGFMNSVQRTLLDWTFLNLRVRSVYLNVLGHNARAIRAYEKVGFTLVARTALVRQRNGDGYNLAPPPAEGEATDLQLARMEINRDSFHQTSRERC